MDPIQLDATAVLELELDGIKLIEASAGTGKTYTIADLYLRHIIAGRQPSQILVVTYTNAATEELQGRIRARLYQALQLLQQNQDTDDQFLNLLRTRWNSEEPSVQQEQIKRLQFGLRSMDEACISTIHGFCQRSLQDQALGGNQFFDSELLENDDALWQQALRDWWRKLIYRLDQDSWQLIRNQLPQMEVLKGQLFQVRNKPLSRLLPQNNFELSALPQQMKHTVSALHQLSAQWQEQRSEIVDILNNSKVLSRAQKLPYHRDRLPLLIASADRFFGAHKVESTFENFEYLGSELLHINSTDKKRGQDPQIDHEFFQAVSNIAASWIEIRSSIKPMLIRDAYTFVENRVAELKREIPALAFQDQLSMMMEALESEHGDDFAAQLQQQFPVAMIDEFQDTDSMQYRIFSRIYTNGGGSGFTMIGDPKQAIYSFRGGDIFTYMQARQLQGITLYSLLTNWRSEPRLVNAINTLFESRSDSFIYPSIPFAAATSNPANERHELIQHEASSTPFILWQLPQNEQQKNYTRDQARELINQAIATEIGGLLSAGEETISIDGKPLQSGDIAILVRQASEGQALARVLHEHGIRSVTIGRENVFRSEEALGLYDLLVAIAQREDPFRARRSLASGLLGFDYRQIAEFIDDDNQWQDWLDKLTALQQRWQQHGFISMFQSLLHCFDVSARLAHQSNSERRLTNLLHLAELLHQQSASLPGITPLLTWFQQQFELDTGENAELRLENDEALVKIVTIHKSKGLQYPVVFVPFLWSCKSVAKDPPIYYHDDELSPCIDLGSGQQGHQNLADKERLAEDLRLLYVALTRARSRVYLAWGEAGDRGKAGYANQTALAWLLHSSQTADQLEQQLADGFPPAMDFEADLEALVARSQNCIERISLPQQSAPNSLANSEIEQPYELAEFTRKFTRPWRVSSFTGLTRGIHQTALHGKTATPDDHILAFPAGSHIGLLIHALLEHLDFEADIATQCVQLLPTYLPASGISAEADQKTLIHWLQQILLTPLNQQGLMLKVLSAQQRLNELTFDFALDYFDLEAINSLLQSLSSVPLQPVTSAAFSGLITGVIDLVFEYQGRYYLADYKSNFLGGSIEDYHPDKLQQAMFDRRYDLQSLLYSIALHRYLSMRLPNYNYETHFGGCYYLFLRAMRPEQGERFGVHFERQSSERLHALDRLLDFTAEETD
jgi:exodeoxyribonuclease V beta subunit